MDILACSVDGCERPIRNKRGWCSRHYYKVMKYGDPLAGRVQYKTPEESFAARTRREGDCLVWTAGGNGTYGVISVGNGEEQYAHRYAWERSHGPIPDGMMPDHRCHNKRCVEVDHLRLVTKVQNAQNVRGPKAGNTSGYLGVGKASHGKWVAYVRINKKTVILGRFDDPAEAGEVAKAARLEHYTHNDHDRAA